MIEYGCQLLDDDDIAAVVEVLKSPWLTQGPWVSSFEHGLCRITQAEHAVAVSNGTAALHLAALALGIQAGDEVWVSAISFVASANGFRYCGANIRFIDCESDSGNLSVTALANALEQAKANHCLPKALVVVHLAGLSADMAAIHALVKPYGIAIVEDACHALGGSYQGHPIGSCAYSDLAVFSFHPVKPITTAEGGAITTNDANLAQQLRLLRSHGISRNRSEFVINEAPPWHYEMQQLGYNYRLSDVQAALGVSQLKKLSLFRSLRAKLAERYQQQLAQTPLFNLPAQRSDRQHGWHLYQIQVPATQRLALYQHLLHAGIRANVHYALIAEQPYYLTLGDQRAQLPNASRFAQQTLSLPLHTQLTYEQQDCVIEALKAFVCV